MAKKSVKKTNKKTVDTENMNIEKYLPWGVMIGVIMGTALSIVFDDIMYTTYGIVGGLLLAIIFGSALNSGK